MADVSMSCNIRSYFFKRIGLRKMFTEFSSRPTILFSTKGNSCLYGTTIDQHDRLNVFEDDCHEL
jgi:hypothetical protein